MAEESGKWGWRFLGGGDALGPYGTVIIRSRQDCRLRDGGQDCIVRPCAAMRALSVGTRGCLHCAANANIRIRQRVDNFGRCGGTLCFPLHPPPPLLAAVREPALLLLAGVAYIQGQETRFRPLVRAIGAACNSFGSFPRRPRCGRGEKGQQFPQRSGCSTNNLDLGCSDLFREGCINRFLKK